MNAHEILNDNLNKLAAMNGKVGLAHETAMSGVRVDTARLPNRFEAQHELALSALMQGLANYAEAHERRFASKLADDGVLGPAWLDAARGFVALLNGCSGRLDCGTLDGTIRQVATEAGFTEEL